MTQSNMTLKTILEAVSLTPPDPSNGKTLILPVGMVPTTWGSHDNLPWNVKVSVLADTPLLIKWD